MSPNSNPSALSDAEKLTEVQSWLSALHFPDQTLTLTPSSLSYLHRLATQSQAESRAAEICAADFRRKAAELRAETARVREVTAAAGLGPEYLSPECVRAAECVGGVANLLGIRDVEITSFLVANADLMIRKDEVAEKRATVQKECKMLLEYTRKGINKHTEHKNTMQKFESKEEMQKDQMDQWKSNLDFFDRKEQQYTNELANYQAVLNRAGYTSDINHGVLMQLAEEKKDLEKKTKPLLETLKSYHELPPDKMLAALAIEEKKREYAAAEKYLDDILHSAYNAPQL